LKEGLKIKELIQVCYDTSDYETKKREIKALLRAMQEFKLKEGLVITEDYENRTPRKQENKFYAIMEAAS
jgi:predicted AAA+ superfamily ATPase